MSRISTLIILLFLASNSFAQNEKQTLPEPQVITPSKKGQAPSDALVLFSKGSLENFESANDGSPAKWKVQGKKFTVVEKTGSIQTKERFGDCQLHIEWRTPPQDVKEGKEGQQCGNSGIYLMGKYEVQVLNSYINKTDYDRMAGSVYSQHAPLVNASIAPGKWQTYDIIFTAPRFNGDGSVKSHGRLTVIHNGVLIQNNVKIGGSTQAASNKYRVTEPELPLMLQDHSNEVSYRNIWIRRL
jgi:hypothetical protein